ncbi:MAG: serpin family protein [Bacteroidaceae bacterium]|nr:serpin family protein [Bacteroidaceae bacterium]
MKKFTLLLVTILMAVTSMAQDYEPKQIELTEAEWQLVQGNNDFAFRLFQKARTEKSQILSPLSITYALGMLNNGAQGKTQQEINEVLGFGEAGADAINKFCRKLLTESVSLDKETKVSIANNIYVNTSRGYRLKSPFVEKAAQYYDAVPESRDFTDGKTRDVINQWGSDHTQGMIKEILKADEFDPGAISYLLNALYFKGAWVNKFDPKWTHLEYFDKEQTKTAEMMWQEGEFPYAENDLYQSLIMPYGNGAYQMTVYLPRYGKTIDDVLDALGGKNGNQDKYRGYNVYLSFPRFETGTDLQLKEIMSSLGMSEAFAGEGFNEFCYEGDDEANSYPVNISFMKQSAKIKVNEEGSEAAAVTVIGVKNGVAGGYVEFVANRPFLYTISERSTSTIFFIGQYMGDPIENARKDLDLARDEWQLVQSNNDFAFRLFKKARTEGSQIISPLSITYALGMLNNGAAGKTQEEINEVLGFGKAGADAINKLCRKLLTEAPGLDKETKVSIANTIFVNKGQGYKLQPAFVEKANEFYDAQPESRDFNDGQTRDVINQWGSDHTEGMIKEVLKEDEFNPFAVSYLLNALYFKGTWMNKFDPANTREEAFNGGKTVRMMHMPFNEVGGGEEFLYSENNLYQAIDLPYGNGAYSMTVFLPREGKTVADVLEKMDGQSWPHLFGNAIVDLKLPCFETNTNVDLKPIMQALGMPTAFNPYAAEFPYFCNEDVYIELMKQAAKIKVNEQGTEAAAITVIGMEATGMAPPHATFHATRPFLYIISEKSTGAIFFIGQYAGDGTTGISDLVRSEGRSEVAKERYYNLQGQQLQTPPAKGIYIKDGKKVLVK